ncbi:MAG: zinc ribbon domain-containing protein [Chloroflexi bacterium]|nr:zinc ribbon domain-containing protein [Chloroflexota bacterium]
MLVCAKCSRLNPEGANTCSACGASLAEAKYRACPTCGTINSIRDMFCFRCLTLLPPADDQIDTANIGDSAADIDLDPLAALTHALPEAQLDFTVPPGSSRPPHTAPTGISGIATAISQISGPSHAQPSISRVAKILIYAGVILAALIPLLAHIRPSGATSARESVYGLLQSLEDIPQGAAVLVSFDYGPAYAAELDSLATLILQHLAEHSNKVLIMSTHPLGMANAERLFSTLDLPMEYGNNYLYLGYLPGEESGLRLLLGEFGSVFIYDFFKQQSLDTYPLAREIESLSQVQRVIVLSEDAVTIQRWIEQVQSPTHLSMDALVSASAEPYLTPYYLSRQLSSLTGGLPAALELQAVQKGTGLDLGFSLGLVGLTLLVALITVVTTINDFSKRHKQGR